MIGARTSHSLPTNCLLESRRAWNAGIALGPPVADWRHLDLAAARGTMNIEVSSWEKGEART